MFNGLRIAVACVTAGISLASPVAVGAEVTAEMRTFARVFVTLEARDLKGYCNAMHGATYAGYLGRVCQSSVQNKLKKPDECSTELIAQQAKNDARRCLLMSPAEFEKTALRADEGRTAFAKELASQGIDGEKLLRDERTKLR